MFYHANCKQLKQKYFHKSVCYFSGRMSAFYDFRNHRGPRSSLHKNESVTGISIISNQANAIISKYHLFHGTKEMDCFFNRVFIISHVLSLNHCRNTFQYVILINMKIVIKQIILYSFLK